MTDRSDELALQVTRLLPPGMKKILVAVSGGVDSVVLLHLLKEVETECDLRLTVAHLDHQLRDESGDDAAFVEGLSQQLEIPCRVGRVDVRELAEREKVSLEMAGRDARREFLERVAGESESQLIALAHHQDDQAETFLMRLVRGSGQSGLVCMKAIEGKWWRPLLDVGRRQILEYARRHSLNWVEDASNSDSQFKRNLIRNRVAPLLCELNPQFSATIAATSRRMQLEEDYWQEQVDALLEQAGISVADGLRLKRSALLEVHPALRLRLYRSAIQLVRGGLEGIEAVHLDGVDRLLTGERSQAGIDLPGVWVARRYETLWLRREEPHVPLFPPAVLPVPGRLALPDDSCLRASIVDEPGARSASVVEFALEQLDLPLEIRSWRPGDRFVPDGMSGHQKLKRYFSDNRVELEDRARALVLTSGETILWIIGRRRSAHAPVRRDSSKILRLELV